MSDCIGCEDLAELDKGYGCAGMPLVANQWGLHFRRIMGKETPDWCPKIGALRTDRRPCANCGREAFHYFDDKYLCKYCGCYFPVPYLVFWIPAEDLEQGVTYMYLDDKVIDRVLWSKVYIMTEEQLTFINQR